MPYTNATNSGFAKVSVYEASGTHTWDPRTKVVMLQVYGGGGGGGSGRKGTTNTAKAGGGGGGGAVPSVYRLTISNFGTTSSIVIGAGGTGAAAQTTNSTNGITGGTGGNTSVDNLWTGMGAGGGLGGTNANQFGGANNQFCCFNTFSTSVTVRGGGANITGPAVPLSSIGQGKRYPTAGGGGTGFDGTTSCDGTDGGNIVLTFPTGTTPPWIAGAPRAPIAGVAATAGLDYDSTNLTHLGMGGGGGFSINNTPNDIGVSGAAGGKGGGGGGGGSFGTNSVADSGAGAIGGSGLVIIYEII